MLHQVSWSGNKAIAPLTHQKPDAVDTVSFSGKNKKRQHTPLPIGTLIELDDGNLLPGFKQRPALDIQNLQMDDFVLSHLTKFIHPYGKIVTNLETGQYFRPTVHFSLNHPVGDVDDNSWKNTKYGILLPFKEAIKMNGKPAGCLEVDTFWSKAVDYQSPKAVLFTQDESISKGKAKVISPSEFGLDPNSPVLALKTCEPPHNVEAKLIPKMGKTLMEPGTLTWGEHNGGRGFRQLLDATGAQQRAGFKRLLRQNQLKEELHDLSPYRQLEKIVQHIDFLERVDNNKWIFERDEFEPAIRFIKNLPNADKVVNESDFDIAPLDLRKVFIHQLEEIQKEMPHPNQQKLKITELINLLKNSETPSEAVVGIKRLYQIANICDPAYVKDMNRHHKDAVWRTLADDSLLPIKPLQVGRQTAKADYYGSIPCNMEAIVSSVRKRFQDHHEAERKSHNPQETPRSWAEVAKTPIQPST